MNDPRLDELMGRFRREVEVALGGWEFSSELQERVWQRLAAPSGRGIPAARPFRRVWYARPGLLAGITVAAIAVALLVVGPPDALAPYLGGSAPKGVPQAAVSGSAPSAGPGAAALPESGAVERSTAPMTAQDAAVPGAAAVAVPAPAQEPRADRSRPAGGAAGAAAPAGGAVTAALQEQGPAATAAAVGAAQVPAAPPEAAGPVWVKYSAQVTV